MFVRSPDRVKNGLHLHALAVEGHQERRQSMVALTCGVGAGEEKDVVGHVAVRGEHLLAVDDPAITITSCTGSDGRDIGFRFGLAHADRDDRLTGDHARQDLGSQCL